ncbi:FAD:protein FMN transferase [Polymorphobacter fuscus]|uniref:FAD:protein FMN transferase n=1 Tax=Sandarakinorhabdus fusca TaxID=1439888 RepID=A0A7C9GNW9_9SPHN|nr:FAD:protein FMN transferase [Polymorphobacter fuscus]KAB7648022.1 FAD:protein FMN transferase [Polymorphobacter fuscus]MQT17057.1 FAD:protein FMN transferase [Polymorphobacter fuscus]
MGTRWSARIVVNDPAQAESLTRGLQAVLDGVVATMSHWDAASNLSRFNRAPPGEWQQLPPDLATVLRAGLDIAARSRGAFDPAIGHLVNHWGFGCPGEAGAAGSAPDAWRSIALDGDAARRTADVRLDLSGIAKGYAVDAMALHLTRLGLRDFLVEAGGELRGEGCKPDGTPWWVDLETVPGLAMPLTRVALCGLSAATSGDYRRYRLEAGTRHSHSIDPRSGHPIANGVASVTVLHRTAMAADAWATALTVLGQAAGMALARAENLAVLMITRRGEGAVEALSPAFAAMLE